MNHKISRLLFFAAVIYASGCVFVPAIHAGPFDKLKKKMERKATEKTDQAIETSVDKAAEGGESAVTGQEKTVSCRGESATTSRESEGGVL